MKVVPAVFWVAENIAFVHDTRNTVIILVSGCHYFHLSIKTRNVEHKMKKKLNRVNNLSCKLWVRVKSFVLSQ